MGEHLDAGPALDVEVHNRVFGCEITCAAGINCADIPPFSTDIEAAMLVVARFTEAPAHHPCLHHFEMVFYAGESQWKVEIGGRECGQPLHPVTLQQEDWSESLPEAICRCAILALADDRAR